jgi:hypothetical protein
MQFEEIYVPLAEGDTPRLALCIDNKYKDQIDVDFSNRKCLIIAEENCYEKICFFKNGFPADENFKISRFAILKPESNPRPMTYNERFNEWRKKKIDDDYEKRKLKK